MNSWKIGDRAILFGLTVNAHLNGTEVTIMSSLRQNLMSGDMVHDLDVLHPRTMKRGNVEPKYLRPIPYDGNNASTWDQCEFKPAVLVEL